MIFAFDQNEISKAATKSTFTILTNKCAKPIHSAPNAKTYNQMYSVHFGQRPFTFQS